MDVQKENIDFFIHKRALLISDDECGDAGLVKIHNENCFIALIDALGHGKTAHRIATMTEDYIVNNIEKGLVEILNGLHVHLKETRGAVASLCKLNISSGELKFAGVGNISTRIIGAKLSRLIPSDGIIGYMMSNPKEQLTHLSKSDILVLYSDGISDHFSSNELISLLPDTAKNIAIDILERFGKDNDDKSCLILKYKE